MYVEEIRGVGRRMSRKKSPRLQHHPKTLKLAIANVKSGLMNQRQAAEIYGIPRTTISNYITGRTVFVEEEEMCKGNQIDTI